MKNIRNRLQTLTAVLFSILLAFPCPSWADEMMAPPDSTAVVPTVAVEEALSPEPSAEPVDSLGLPESSSWTPWNQTLSQVQDASTPVETSTTTGRSFYVSKTGSNSNQGSQTNPWSSIQYALSKLQAGDTLYLMEGVYAAEGAKFSTSGRSSAYITLQGLGNVVIQGTGENSKAAFLTQGRDYLRFRNLTVTDALASVDITSGSSFVEVDGIRTDRNRFHTRIYNSSNITVRNAYADNSKNAFRAYGSSRNLLFENIEAYNSKDIYVGMNPNYRNGDGFILEATVTNVTMRNIISANHWDAGFDIKASNVLIENVIAYGNKNNFKMWGNNITIKSSLSHHAKSELRPDGTTVEGNGITVEAGTTKLVQVTLADNEDHDVKIYAQGTLRMENCIVARRATSGGRLFDSDGGLFTSDTVLWHETGRASPNFTISPSDLWADPQFVDPENADYHLQATSPAVDRAATGLATFSLYDLDLKERVAGDQADLGAYEFQQTSTNVASAPASEPPAVSEPAPTPAVISAFQGVIDGQTVSNRIFVQPNLDAFPGGITKVIYSLNGKTVGRPKSKPFALGGSKGFSISKWPEGKQILTAVVVTPEGEVSFSITLDVLND